jgi:hypothetical protein
VERRKEGGGVLDRGAENLIQKGGEVSGMNIHGRGMGIADGRYSGACQADGEDCSGVRRGKVRHYARD